MDTKNLLLKATLAIVFLIAIVNANIIESISFSKIKDTIYMVFEVDTATRFTINRVSNAHLKIEADACSAVEQLKPYANIQKIVINSDDNRSTFDLTFNKPFDYKRQKTASSVLIKFYPMAIRQIKTIVLDPGHGGVDPGAIGKKKLQEKDVNLKIAKILKKKLENYGLKVLMTRTDDRFVALSERTRFANEKKADLFVSIHCNASEHNKKACGFETYFLSEAKTDWERAVLARENGALRFEIADTNPLVKNDLDLILADLTQNEFLKESYNLALEIQTAGIDILTDVDRGVRQAGFYVLRGCFMPSVLIECGFISNPTEEKKLASAKYQEKVAQAIYTGIINYIKDYEKRNNI
ncbi:MAG: N-acetylmuramoyl-L-alanine amidase [candidate division WOR-3 bacterium]|nr:N-acetylmuramoyl-L-alanine amidase [candidate division WOR-3 bacterium]